MNGRSIFAPSLSFARQLVSLDRKFREDSHLAVVLPARKLSSLAGW